MAHHDTSLIFALATFAHLAHVDTVANGVACGCHCPECGEPVIAVQGDVLAHHFRHTSESACGSGYETMAHILAKQIIAEEKQLRLPALTVKLPEGDHLFVEDQIADLESVDIEPWRKGIRPDAVAKWDNTEIGIEVYVTNLCDPLKVKGYSDRKLAAIEIDLSGFAEGLEPKPFRDAVIFGARRRWLFHPYQNEPARRVERKLLQHNAEIAKSHADSRQDPVGQALVDEWFRHFWAGA